MVDVTPADNALGAACESLAAPAACEVTDVAAVEFRAMMELEEVVDAVSRLRR
jgi:hypothetical protein